MEDLQHCTVFKTVPSTQRLQLPILPLLFSHVFFAVVAVVFAAWAVAA